MDRARFKIDFRLVLQAEQMIRAILGRNDPNRTLLGFIELSLAIRRAVKGFKRAIATI